MRKNSRALPSMPTSLCVPDVSGLERTRDFLRSYSRDKIRVAGTYSQQKGTFWQAEGCRMSDEQSTIVDRKCADVRVGVVDRHDPPNRLCFAGFEFDLPRERLLRDGEAIALRPKPTALLIYFLKHPQRVLDKEELL